MQGNALMAPIMAKAARKLGIDQVAIHRINAPEGKAPFGAPNARGSQSYTTSAFLKDALDKGAELFNWEERKARSGQRNGSKVRGVGVAVSAYSAGSMGFDGLFVIKPDGRDDDPVGHRQPRHRIGVRRASRRRRNRRHAVGEVSTSPGATPRRTCRRPAARAAARRRTR